MIHRHRRPGPAMSLVASLVATLALTACRVGAGPSPSVLPSVPSPTPSFAPTPSPQPSQPAAPSATVAASPTASADGALGPFVVAPNADADALFLARDQCENLDAGYRVVFPDSWWTNTAIGDVGPCAWFSPITFRVTDPTVVPDEVAITITWIPGDSGSHGSALSREFGIIGETQPAVRVEWQESDGTRRYVYQVQLGPTPEEGPNLLAVTSTDMGGDYELNKAVLDRIMVTMELVGTTVGATP